MTLTILSGSRAMMWHAFGEKDSAKLIDCVSLLISLMEVVVALPIQVMRTALQWYFCFSAGASCLSIR